MNLPLPNTGVVPRSEKGAKPLNPRQLAFVDEYMKDRNATQAAQRSGYKQARVAGPRLLSDVAIKAEITRRLEEYSRTAGIEPVRLLEVAKWGCLTDIREAFDEQGGIKHPKEWSRELAAAISGYTGAGEKTPEKIQFQDQPALALKLLDRIRPLTPPAPQVMVNIQINAEQALTELRASLGR